MSSAEEKKANRLIKEKSPYLLQHAYNPVNWYPWGEEAFERALEEDKPIFLSIGYSTCHWCHVMEKDSFEDQEAADLINEHFVPIKVDREERPDLDQKYMLACQALTGQGGWPLTVFLTPDKKPFYAATFIPKKARYGMNGLMEILPKLSEFWKNDRQRVIKAGDELVAAFKQAGKPDQTVGFEESIDLPGEEILEKAAGHLKASYDREYGGFGRAPKFPAAHQLIYLLRRAKSSGDEEAGKMAVDTLRAIYRGGIFDQLGFGMHRYSVDEKWLVPHFEKMLYDQAITALAALEAYRLTDDEEMSEFARKIFTYVLKDLASPEGAFYSAEDADTEGKEGIFYSWRPEEFKEVLGDKRGAIAARYYGVTERGNFEEGSSVLHRNFDDETFAAAEELSAEQLAKFLEEVRQELLDARNRRERPFRDDKILTSWNGLIIAALARGAKILNEPEYLTAAERAANFVAEHMVSSEGMLMRRYRDGEAAIPAFLDDYANLTWGYIEIYRAGNEQRYFEEAERLTREMLKLFKADNGMLRYSTHDDGPEGYSPEAEANDAATPSGLSVAVMNLLQMGRMLGEESFTKQAAKLIKGQNDNLERYPTGFTYLLTALNYTLKAGEDLSYCTSDGDCGWE